MLAVAYHAPHVDVGIQTVVLVGILGIVVGYPVGQLVPVLGAGY